MSRRAWRTCPECGRKSNGWQAGEKHKRTHPGLLEKEKVTNCKLEINRIQESIKEAEGFEHDLTLQNLSPMARMLIVGRMEYLQRQKLQEWLQSTQDRLAEAEAALARVMQALQREGQAEAAKEAQNAEAVHEAVQTVAARLSEGG